MTEQQIDDAWRAACARHEVTRDIVRDFARSVLGQNADAPVATPQKYDDVLLPFLALMRAELHANAGKGDRPGWLTMDRKTAILEIHHHLAKLQKAVLSDSRAAIAEHAADVANMAMMAVDVCGLLEAAPPAPQPAPTPNDELAVGSISDLWHEGTRSFYKARVLKKLTPEQALFDPLDPDWRSESTPKVQPSVLGTLPATCPAARAAETEHLHPVPVGRSAS